MPNSLILLNIQNEQVKIELQLPVQEFELAYGQNLKGIDSYFIESNKDRLTHYILSHVALNTQNEKKWNITVADIRLDSVQSEFNGVYKELIYELTCNPIDPKNVRQFTLYYDAIIHQVVTHFAIVKINQDFNNGIIPEHPSEIGIIQLDIASNTVKPFHVNIDEGSKWQGFKKMVSLGMHHIQTGIDHLLFLLVIILIAPLMIEKKRWASFGGKKYTLIRVLKIITAFTIGHSITLMLFSFCPIPNYSQWIEVAIGFTIFISAIHAIRPIFPNKEIGVTLFFGMIHGCAFAATLFDLNLDTSLKLLTLLGFNLGIECMQIILIAGMSPLLFLSQYPQYKWIRVSISLLSIAASIAWILARISGEENALSRFLDHLL
jgi:hypothetical protein